MKSIIAFDKGVPFSFILFLLFFIGVPSFGQNSEIERLREQRESKQKRIELLQQWMQDIKQTQSASREQVSLLNEQIQLIKGQLSGLRKEVILFEDEISRNLEQIDLLEEKIEQGYRIGESEQTEKWVAF